MAVDLEAARAELIELLEARGAHMPFEAAVADFPTDAINRPLPGLPAYTPWCLLDHIRYAQWDILDYIRNRDYLEATWPDNYWPPAGSAATREQFDETIAAFHRDRAALRALVADPATDLFAQIPDTPGHTVFRELRIVGAHNAYHIGEFAILRQVMDTWPPDRSD
jgi:DinB superfamily